MVPGTICMEMERWQKIPGLVHVMSIHPVHGYRMLFRVSGSVPVTVGGIDTAMEAIR